MFLDASTVPEGYTIKFIAAGNVMEALIDKNNEASSRVQFGKEKKKTLGDTEDDDGSEDDDGDESEDAFSEQSQGEEDSDGDDKGGGSESRGQGHGAAGGGGGKGGGGDLLAHISKRQRKVTCHDSDGGFRVDAVRRFFARMEGGDVIEDMLLALLTFLPSTSTLFDISTQVYKKGDRHGYHHDQYV
jgi:hypothetical protein